MQTPSMLCVPCLGEWIVWDVCLERCEERVATSEMVLCFI